MLFLLPQRGSLVLALFLEQLGADFGLFETMSVAGQMARWRTSREPF